MVISVINGHHNNVLMFSFTLVEVTVKYEQTRARGSCSMRDCISTSVLDDLSCIPCPQS